jgi:hypothetical protein
MARLLLIVCAILACLSDRGAAQVIVQSPPEVFQSVPPARLIRPRPGRIEVRPFQRVPPRLFPMDERCRVLKEQLEAWLQAPANPRRVFQARVAHNAGARLCREGQPEKGMAEFEKGLSYLQH